MGFRYTFTDKQGYLLVTIIGSPANNDEMFHYIDSLFREARQRGYTCILVDETRATLRFDILDSIFKTKIPSLEVIPTQIINMALIPEPHSIELYKFFEGMLRNQAFCFKVFDDVALGEKWLKESCSNAGQRNRPYAYTAIEKQSYVRINIEGQLNTVNDVLVFVGDAIREATAHKTTCILLAGHDVEMDLDVSEAFKVAQTMGDYIPLLSMRIASVPSAKNKKLQQFFETAFQNRSISYRVFDSEPDAEAWLLTRECRATG
ncbi:hypothetical protein [Pseudodesulfovibrio portus]|uniref:DUF4180 domain-containing protein n=1 Tax=Pseudodesulfovibrio portus TaxID=231439 RepID=A0ABN6RPP1_9BACT|nr:hypothetical protein [Pseudodesulfovibrio portus]BDQ32771.1 hypothetical protein JCM14722_03130 [Pseudodesulfovibrio portus]